MCIKFETSMFITFEGRHRSQNLNLKSSPATLTAPSVKVVRVKFQALSFPEIAFPKFKKGSYDEDCAGFMGNLSFFSYY